MQERVDIGKVTYLCICEYGGVSRSFENHHQKPLVRFLKLGKGEQTGWIGKRISNDLCICFIHNFILRAWTHMFFLLLLSIQLRNSELQEAKKLFFRLWLFWQNQGRKPKQLQPLVKETLLSYNLSPFVFLTFYKHNFVQFAQTIKCFLWVVFDL
jgi:hypothetical protein